MLLMSSLQGVQKLDALVLSCQKIQQGIVSFVHRFVTIANLGVLSVTQHLQPQQLIQQPKVWLNDVSKSILQC